MDFIVPIYNLFASYFHPQLPSVVTIPTGSMMEQGNPVLEVDSQNIAIAIDDNIASTRMIPITVTAAPAPPPLPHPPRPPRRLLLAPAAPALSPFPPLLRLIHPPDTVCRKAYQFDGLGQFYDKKWDIAEGTDNKFCWYHLQIDPHYVQPDAYAHILIDSFCPPLKLLDIISLVNDGPFCGSYMNGDVLIFRMNSKGHANGDVPFRVAARVSHNLLITVSWGDVPRLLYKKCISGGNHLLMVPQLERYPNRLERNATVKLRDYYISTRKFVDGQPVDEQHDLVDLFFEARSVQPDSTLPTTMASLVVHVIGTHVDLIRKRIANIEKELNSVEELWVEGNFEHNKKLMDDVNFSEMQLKLQRILQVIAQTKQVLHQVRDECRNIEWLKVLAAPDGSSLQEILGRPKVLRESVKILANRIAATHARLVDTIQSQQINRRVYILSIVSMIFLPLSIITGVFSMQVRGIPWIGQDHPEGFRNVVIVSIIAALGILMLYFIIPAIFRVAVRRRQKWLNEKLSKNV